MTNSEDYLGIAGYEPLTIVRDKLISDAEERNLRKYAEAFGVSPKDFVPLASVDLTNLFNY